MGVSTTWSNGYAQQVITAGTTWSGMSEALTVATKVITVANDPDVTFSYTDGANASLLAAMATFQV
jgi:deoxyxylulose-5-phosphate synthase